MTIRVCNDFFGNAKEFLVLKKVFEGNPVSIQASRRESMAERLSCRTKRQVANALFSDNFTRLWGIDHTEESSLSCNRWAVGKTAASE